jgi:hypothetical protein
MGEVAVPSAHQKKKSHTIKVPQRTVSGEIPFVKRKVYLWYAFAHSERALQYTNFVLDSDPTARWFASFSSFFFQIKKKDTVLPFEKGKSLFKIPVGRQIKNTDRENAVALS